MAEDEQLEQAREFGDAEGAEREIDERGNLTQRQLGDDENRFAGLSEDEGDSARDVEGT